MKQLFFMVGAIFVFASCQSDLLESDDSFLNEASKSDNAMKVTKNITFNSYKGEIGFIPVFEPGPDDCNVVLPGEDYPLQFWQTGYGEASHIGAYTFANYACLGFGGLEDFEGVMIAANGDEIHYTLNFYKCDSDGSNYCPGEPVTLNYTITGGTGRFYEAEGWFEFKVLFVPAGEFEVFRSGWGEITY